MKFMDILVALLFLAFIAIAMGGINDHFFRFFIMTGLVVAIPAWVCVRLVKKHWRVK